MKTKKIFTLMFVFSAMVSQAQSDLDRVLKGGELLLGGLSILKVANSEPKDSKIIKSFCVRNKLAEKITFRLISLKSDEEIIKELVIPKDGKECLLELPKGIYSYEIVLSNKDIYKKGEYLFDDETTITIKPD